MRFSLLFLLITLIVAATGVHAQRHYITYFAALPPVIDGKGDDAVWQHAPWTEDFIDIQGEGQPRPMLRTRVKMLWDSVNLYLYAELEEPDLWGTLTQHDAVIYHDNDFEVFIDPHDDTQNYYELEFNALGTVMDLFLTKPYRNGGKALLGWDAQGLRSAVYTRGTLNRPGDRDQGWSLELAIPLKSVHFYSDKPTKDGDRWRINFSRVEWDRVVKDGQYVVSTDSAGKRKPEHNWVWTPQGAIAMHLPEKWGYLQFSSHTGGRDPVPFIPPADQKTRELLWQIYYKQQDYRREHGHYASSLQELGVEADGAFRITLEAISRQYTAVVSSGPTELAIDQDGKVSVH